MSYISHGLVTEKLLEADPFYELEVMETFPFMDQKSGRLHCEAVKIRLTIHDDEGWPHVIEEFGGAQRIGVDKNGRTDGFAVEVKNAISDAIKRAAMRRGVALEMWESLIDAEYDEDVHPEYVSPAIEPGFAKVAQIAQPAAREPAWIADLWSVAEDAHIDKRALDKRCMELYGVMSDSLDPQQARDVIAKIQSVEKNRQTVERPGRPAPKEVVNGQRVGGSGKAASEKQLKMLWALANQKGASAEEIHAFIREVFDKDSTKDLTTGEAGVTIDMLMEKPDALEQAPIQEMEIEEPAWMRNPDYSRVP